MLVWRLLFFFAALIFNGAPSRGQEEGCQGTQHRFCSRTFRAAYRCDDPHGHGLALIHENHCPAGQTCRLCPSGRECPLIEPWEPMPIKIVGVELAVLHGTLLWAFAGNNHVPDVMVTMGTGQTRVQQWFPVGLTFSLPPKGITGGHIDFHVACEKGWFGRRRWVHLYYTIYYTTGRGG